MKRLINLPLLIAAAAQLLFASYALMPGPWAGWEDGPSRGAMAYIMFEAALVSWLALLVAGVGAVFTDAYDWPAVTHRLRRRVVIFAATLLAAGAIAACMVITIGSSPATGGRDFAGYAVLLTASARIGGTIVPLIVIAWLGWLINAPASRRHAAWARGIAFTALALTLPGGLIGVAMLSEEIAGERQLAASYRAEEDKNEAENAAHFASLSDASPLSSWGGYATNTVYYAERFRSAEDKMRDEALRRLAARPTLEADIAKDLVASYAQDSDIAFLLVARVQFTPSTALEAPLRSAIGRIVAEMRKAGPGNTWPTKPGDEDILDSYIRSEFAERLAASLVIATRMAASGVDLRDELGRLRSAALDAYPKTKSAIAYDREVAATDAKIAAILGARQKTD